MNVHRFPSQMSSKHFPRKKARQKGEWGRASVRVPRRYFSLARVAHSFRRKIHTLGHGCLQGLPEIGQGTVRREAQGVLDWFITDAYTTRAKSPEVCSKDGWRVSLLPALRELRQGTAMTRPLDRRLNARAKLDQDLSFCALIHLISN